MPLLKSVFLAISLIGQSEVAVQKPEMYLCIDSMMNEFKQSGVTPPKLVYGYIDGEKTECMTEHQLRAKYSDSKFKNSRKSEIEISKPVKNNFNRSASSNLKNAVFRGKKDLAGIDLKGWDLKGVDMSGADLRNANLESTDFRNANLSGANLQGASLEHAFLKDANLRNADLSNVRMKGAYFQHADFSGVKGLSLEHIRVVTTVYNAVFDNDMMELIKEYCSNKLKDPGWQWESTVFSSDSLIPENERANRKQFH